MKKTKCICLLCTLVIVVGIFSACNSGKKEPTGSSEPTVSTESQVGSTVSDPYTDLPGTESTDDADADSTDAWSSDESDSVVEEPFAPFQATISLFNDKPVQTDFLGFNGIYHAFPYRLDAFGREYTDRMAEAELDRAAYSGMKIARTYYCIDDVWNSKTKTWAWDGETMQAIVDFCLGLKKRNVDVLLSHWNAGDFLTTTYHWSDQTANGTTNAGHEAIRGDGKAETMLQNFAVFMSDSVQYLHAKGCTNVTQLSLTTEPGGTTWSDTWGDISGQVAHQKAAAKVIADAHNAVSAQLKADSIRSNVQIQGPNIAAEIAEYGSSWLTYFLQYVDADAYDLMSAHNYHGSDMTADNYFLWDEWLNEIETAVPMTNFIYDEYNSRPAVDDRVLLRQSGHNGVQLALGQVSMMNHGVHGSFLWSLFDQQWPDSFVTAADSGFYDGIQINGLAPSFLTSSIVFQPYYSFSIVANAITSGDTIYAGDDETDSGVYAAMSKGADGSWNIVVVSTNILETEITLNFEKSLGGAILYRHAYAADTITPTAEGELIKPDLKLTDTTTVLEDIIPAYSVVVYTTKQMCK